MSTGNLIGKVIAVDFWPACHNCVRYDDCLARSKALQAGTPGPVPRHPDFPRRWDWTCDSVPLPSGERLVLNAWAGAVTFYGPHTGCYAYTVSKDFARLPREGVEQVLWALWQGVLYLEQVLHGIEMHGELDDAEARAFYKTTLPTQLARLQSCYGRILIPQRG